MNKPESPSLVIVIPCYNEEEVLPETVKCLSQKLDSLVSGALVSESSALLFVDDGSSDNTWNLIEKYHRENPQVFKGIKLSKNFGQQNAILCGLLAVKGFADVAISIDADLQNDLGAVDKMLMSFLSGAEIVFGVHSGRESDSILRRISARCFYRFTRFLGIKLVDNHAHFRLMGKAALNALNEYEETKLFLPGIASLLGFKTDIVHCKVKKRSVGKSKYNLRELFELTLKCITSFSVKPLRFITGLGAFLLVISLALSIWFFINYVSGCAVTPFAVLLCSIWVIGGLIVLSIGIVGEYIGNIYAETKRRPRYHIEKCLFTPEPENESK